jgi:hypothetical protein
MVGSRLDLMVSGSEAQPTSPNDELIPYLDSGMSLAFSCLYLSLT